MVATKSSTAKRMARRAPVLSLVPNTVSKVTIGELGVLTREAFAGELVGLAYVAIYRGRKCAVHVSGEAARNPTYTRGAILALDDMVREKVLRHE